MNAWKSRLGAGPLLALVLALSGHPAEGAKIVLVGNTKQHPVPVTEVRSPVQFACAVTLPPGVIVSTGLPDACLTAAVPTDKRLVIEFVDAVASLPNGQVPSLIIQTSAQEFGQPAGTTVGCNHAIAFPRPDTVGTLDVYTATHMVSMYADPTAIITIVFERTGITDSATFQLNWSGYLVDAP